MEGGSAHLTELDEEVVSGIRGLRGLDNLDELHHGDRIEEVETTKAKRRHNKS